VMLVEYADYECPYCQQIQPALAKLEADFKGKIAFAFKDAPLPMHANAQKAAESAHCAAEQGRYWEDHDLLFAKSDLQLPRLKEYAQSLKMDGAAFAKCLDSGAHDPLVKSQLAEAQALGVPGTPAFFINGRFITGAVSYDSLRQVIEEELRTSTAAKRPASR
jgi:protein-disulfide isomerase